MNIIGAQKNRRDENGAVAVLVAMLSLVMFVLSALAVDLAHAHVVKREAQNASDASALAAGNALYISGTKTPDIPLAASAAKSYASENYGITNDEWTACVDSQALAYPLPDTECISFDSATQPSRVRVVIPVRDVATPFARIIGVNEVAIDALAEATLSLGGKSDCGLCVLGDGTHDLQNGDAKISGGNIHFNGNVDVNNNGLVATDGSISVEGTASGPLTSYDPDPLTNQPRVDDPLSGLVFPPDYSALTVKSDPCGTGVTHGPGRYNGWNFPNGTCVLQPGLYIVTGEWTFSGNAALTANGVTLYFMCGTASAPVNCAPPGQDGGWLNAHGNGDVIISAPTTGATKGLAIVYDRLNTQQLWLTGNGASKYVGTIYAPSASMDYRGNGCSTTNQSLIIVNELAFSGTNACLRSDYLESVNVEVPPGRLHLSK